MAESDVTSMHTRRAMAGHPESLDWIVRRFTPLLLAQARHHMGRALLGKVDHEDLVAETWLVALPRLEGLLPDNGSATRPVLAFLSSTIRIRIIDMARKLTAGHRLTAPIGDQGGSGSGWALSAQQSGIITKAARAEVESAVLDAINELDDVDRQIVILRGIEENSIAAVALIVDMAPNAVTKRYQRAIQKLREKIPQSVFDELVSE